MRWPTAVLLATLGAAGCRNSQPTCDPFLPRTRIPPPPTGAATGAPDAFYTSPTPPMTGAAPGWPAPAAATPATGADGLYAPPGGFQYQQSAPPPGSGSSGYSPTPGPAPVNSSSAATPTIDRSTVKRTKYVATADTARSAVYERDGQAHVAQQPPTLAANDSSAADGDSADAAVDIMDLPPVKRVARAR